MNYIIFNVDPQTFDEEVLEEINISSAKLEDVEKKAKLYCSKYQNSIIILYKEKKNGELQKVNSFSFFDS